MKKYSKFILCIVFVLSTVLTVAIAIGIANDDDDGLMMKPSQAVYLGQIFQAKCRENYYHLIRKKCSLRGQEDKPCFNDCRLLSSN